MGRYLIKIKQFFCFHDYSFSYCLKINTDTGFCDAYITKKCDKCGKEKNIILKHEIV